MTANPMGVKSGVAIVAGERVLLSCPWSLPTLMLPLLLSWVTTGIPEIIAAPSTFCSLSHLTFAGDEGTVTTGL